MIKKTGIFKMKVWMILFAGVFIINLTASEGR